MLSLSALMLSSLLLTADAGVPHSGTQQAAPAKASPDDRAEWRSSVIALSVVGGAVAGGIGTYFWEYNRNTGGSYPALNAAVVGVMGGLMGGFFGGLIAAVLTNQWTHPAPVALIPTAGGRETGGLHVLVTF